MRPNIAPALATIVFAIFSLPLLSKSNPEPTHQPSVPKKTSAKKEHHEHVQKPPVPMSAEGGVWRTDHNFHSIFMIKNILEITPITVSPVLFMADGTEYDLAPVNLDVAGVAMLNVDDALSNAPAEVRSHISTYGSAGIRFQWGWAGSVFAAIRTTDEVRGLLYQTHLEADANKTHDSTVPSSTQVLEGLWWKQGPGVKGFVTLMNTATSEITATIETFASGRTDISTQSVDLAPHSTQMLDISSIWSKFPPGTLQGGVRITYSGMENSIIVEGGLEDEAKGYSHMLHFETLSTPPSPSFTTTDAQPGTQPTPEPESLDSAGLMVGAQEAEMQFPKGTAFLPYAVVGNTTDHALSIQLTANIMSGSVPEDIPLSTSTLSPHEVQQVDMKAVLKSVGLDTYNGYLNLRTSYVGTPTDVLEESGSVDQTLNYIFEVPPRLERWSQSRIFNYWNANGDTDTMFTLWNYSDKDEELVLTFFHQEGKYEMPIHLAAHGSTTMTVGKLIRSGAPDRNGKSIPTNVVQGSAKISGMNGNKDRIDVAVAAGIFNARTATCSYPCGPCDGIVDNWTAPGWVSEGVGKTIDLVAFVQYSDGTEQEVTAEVSFDSSDTTIAVVNAQGQVLGVAIGNTVFNGNGFFGIQGGTYSCSGNNINSCGAVEPQFGGDVDIEISIFMNGDDVTGTTQTVVVGQQIKLSAVYQLSSNDTPSGGPNWNVPGSNLHPPTAVGGWTPGSIPDAIADSSNDVTFYWVTPGQSREVVFSIGLVDVDPSPSASVTFDVKGPTSPNIAIQLGQVVVYSQAAKLQLGGSPTNVGISFTASATLPTGFSNTFTFVQKINAYTEVVARNGSNFNCNLGSGLDNAYPYPKLSDTITNDNPHIDLGAANSEHSTLMAAQMYLLWDPDLADDIVVPLGSVSWGYTGDAVQNNQTWSYVSGSGSANSFVTDSTYPTWSSTFINNQNITCTAAGYEALDIKPIDRLRYPGTYFALPGRTHGDLK